MLFDLGPQIRKLTPDGTADLCIQNGAFPSAFPSIAGHEGSGNVVSVGSGVTRVKAGDSVLLSFASCSSCPYCLSGHPAGCTTFVEKNFGRVRNDEVGDRGVAKGVNGEEIKGALAAAVKCSRC